MHIYELFILLLAAMVRVSVPLILAGFAGLFSERSGVVDVGLEGKMLAAAFAAGAVASLTNDAWLGLLAAIGVSVLFGLLHGLACITYRGNQVVAGMAINILVQGLTVVLGRAWFDQGGQTPALSDEARFADFQLPASDTIHDIPIIGPIYSNLIGNHNVPGLYRLRHRAADLVGALSHAVRAAPARGGREIRRRSIRRASRCRRGAMWRWSSPARCAASRAPICPRRRPPPSCPI